MTREKAKRAAYTLEYKLEAVRLVTGGQAKSVTAKVLGIPTQTLDNLASTVCARQADRSRGQASQCGADGTGATASGAGTSEDGARHLKKSDGVLRERCAVKYAWITRHKHRWPVTMQCGVLGVSASGYFAQVADSGPKASSGPSRRLSDEAVLAHIKAAHAESKCEYGWPRIWKELLANGVRVGKDRIQKLMKQHGIKARGKRRYVVTTDSRHNLPIAANLLDRNFQPDQPNAVWTGDITYLATDEGWLYLAAVIDLYSRQVVGWSMQAHMQTSLVSDALHMAWFRRHPDAGLIFHSDRGSQYCSHEFQAILKQYGMQSSMSRRGNCWNNAPTESLWGSMKVGRLHGMRLATRRQAMDEVIDWLTFYNHRRLHSTLGYISPMQFEKNWFAAQFKNAA